MKILSNNGLLPTIIIVAILVVIVIFAIISIVKNKGKCSCGCNGCAYSSSCHKKNKK